MFFTHTQILNAQLALDDARRTFDCSAPRKDAAGNTASKTGVTYGTHGSAFLQVDPATGETRCGACAGEMDATVQV